MNFLLFKAIFFGSFLIILIKFYNGKDIPKYAH